MGLARLGLDLLTATSGVRRFRVYNVGIAKTGTQSIATIFSNYRSLHEYFFAETLDAIHARASGDMSDAQFRDFIHWRDGVVRLEVDSSSYNSFYVDVLAQEFADAKFIFVIRDCWSWLDSMLNMALDLGPEMPGWMADHCRTILGPAYAPDLDAREAARRVPEFMAYGFDYWTRANQFVLDWLPPERSLTLRTCELSNSLPRLAAFVGVPPHTLRSDLAHVHRARRQYHLLEEAEPAQVRAAWTDDCERLMQRFYPDVRMAPTLADSARRMVLT